MCGEPVLLDDDAVCQPELTGIRCANGVRCLASPTQANEHTCQDCADEAGERPLRFCSRRRTYEEAQAVCAASDMRLVSVRDAADDAAIFERAQAQFGYRSLYWLGLDDIDEEGTFTWSDGRQWHVGDVEPYASFQPSEPNNFNGAEHCAHTVDGGWNDNQCIATFATICESHD